MSIESRLFIVPLFRVVVGAELSETLRPGINSWVAKRPSSLRSIWASHLQQRRSRDMANLGPRPLKTKGAALGGSVLFGKLFNNVAHESLQTLR